MQANTVTHRQHARWRMRPRNAILLLLCSLGILALTAELWLPLIGRWLAEPAALHPADAVVVSGGTAGRTRYGMQLYEQGLAPELWHTGFQSRQRATTNLALATGVPAPAFHWLATESTWTDGEQIVAFARQRKVRSILVVTDWWHSRRALCSIRSHMQGDEFAVYFVPAPLSGHPPDSWWQDASTRRYVLSELLKFVYYTVRYGMNPWACS